MFVCENKLALFKARDGLECLLLSIGKVDCIIPKLQTELWPILTRLF